MVKLDAVLQSAILPLTMVAYFQANSMTGQNQLGRIYFALFFFLLTHVSSSLLFAVSHKIKYGRAQRSQFLLGFGPAIAAVITLAAITILPFLKWPFYVLRIIPKADELITPFILALMATLVQYVLYYSLSPAISEIKLS